MKRPPRLTRKDKIAMAAEVKAKEITDARFLRKLPPGTYTVAGSAADEVNRQAAKNARRCFQNT